MSDQKNEGVITMNRLGKLMLQLERAICSREADVNTGVAHAGDYYYNTNLTVILHHDMNSIHGGKAIEQEQ